MLRLARHVPGPLVAAAWATLALALSPLVLEDLELRVYDLRQRLQGADAVRRADIVVVNIDEATTEALGWPLPRARWVEWFGCLGAFEPKQVGFDLFLTHHLCSPGDDTLLAATMGQGTPTVLAVGLALPESLSARLPQGPEPADSLLLRWWEPHPELQADPRITHSHRVEERPLAVLVEQAAGAGNAAVDPDRDGVIRRLPLVTEYGGYLVPSFSLAMMLEQEGVAFSQCAFVPGATFTIPGRPPIPLDASSRMILRYNGPPGTFRSFGLFQLFDLMERAIIDHDAVALRELESLRGALLIVGVTDAAQMDLPATPVHPRFPGPEIQATALDNLMRSHHTRRLAFGWEAAAALALALLGALAGLRLRPAPGAMLALLLAIAYVIGVFLLGARAGLWLGTVVPLVALAGSYGTNVTLERLAREKEQRLVKDAFGKYVSPGALKQLLDDPASVLGRRGEKKEITILFSDVKGFSALCEGHEPDPLLTQLNEYLSEMTDIVFSHGGAVDKFMGDGLMAFFGHPVSAPDHARRAVAAGLQMQRRLIELRRTWETEKRLDFHIRIGINSGEVIAGSMGGGRKMDYTVFGRSVNLAQRLESGCDVDGVLVSGDTLSRAGIDPVTATAKTITAKNIGEVTAYQVSIDTDRTQHTRS
ncbi:MAG: adenylate/guanylate cyclase domain-containing protein [Candidatus Eisenbacteria bacterium]|jgi:adenylate cyclase|nr:adenylate/guanylate cyclase domain-containing protein [Candidatus Eisenbacteria bacterium]